MSYNLARKVERSKMKRIISDFKKEAKLSSKGLVALLYPKGNSKISLRDKFSRMLAIAMQKLKEVEDTEKANGEKTN